MLCYRGWCTVWEKHISNERGALNVKSKGKSSKLWGAVFKLHELHELLELCCFFVEITLFSRKQNYKFNRVVEPTLWRKRIVNSKRALYLTSRRKSYKL